MGGFCEVEQVVSEKRCVKRIKKNKLWEYDLETGWGEIDWGVCKSLAHCCLIIWIWGCSRLVLWMARLFWGEWFPSNALKRLCGGLRYDAMLYIVVFRLGLWVCGWCVWHKTVSCWTVWNIGKPGFDWFIWFCKSWGYVGTACHCWRQCAITSSVKTRAIWSLLLLTRSLLRKRAERPSWNLQDGLLACNDLSQATPIGSGDLRDQYQYQSLWHELIVETCWNHGGSFSYGLWGGPRTHPPGTSAETLNLRCNVKMQAPWPVSIFDPGSPGTLEPSCCSVCRSWAWQALLAPSVRSPAIPGFLRWVIPAQDQFGPSILLAIPCIYAIFTYSWRQKSATVGQIFHQKQAPKRCLSSKSCFGVSWFPTYSDMDSYQQQFWVLWICYTCRKHLCLQ